jgi:hypothetical protein
MSDVKFLISLFDCYEGDMTCDNVFNRLTFLVAAHEPDNGEVEFCSSRFFELETSSLHEMPFEVICEIISHPSLKLRNEDSLYEFIKSLVVDESRYSSFFERIRFGYLSSESMCSFIEVIQKSFDFLPLPIWDADYDRLPLSVSPMTSNDRLVESFNSVVYSCREGSSLNGIISYLTKKFDGHVGDRGVVSISAGSVYDSQSYPLRNIADFESQTRFQTNNTPNSWICYDFKNMNIKPTHCALRSRRDDNGGHLRFWALEGSLGGNKWIKLDRRENNTELNIQGAIAIFPISRSDSVHMIRLRQGGKNSSNNDQLIVSAIEVFGVLMEPKQ